MKINLECIEIFEDKNMEFDKPVNFIFGKNGTGKSTITKLIKEQNTDKDVRVYQGVNSVAVDGKLNSVILGEENTVAQRKIESYELKIRDIEGEIEKKNKNIESIQEEYKKIEEQKIKLNNKIEKDIKEAAKEIKNSQLHIASTSYNSLIFKKELKYAFKLSETEKEECKKNLTIQEKIVDLKEHFDINLKDILLETNKVLIKKVEEEKDIIRLSTEEKINFAKKGLELHKEGEVCSFCGNEISNETFQQLEGYFSASKIKSLEKEIFDIIYKVEEIIEKINNFNILPKYFYSIYQSKIEILSTEWNQKLKEHNKFLRVLKERLEKKLTQLFSNSEKISIKIPDSIEYIVEEYNKIAILNNNEDVSRIKNFSKDILRFDYIYYYKTQYDLENKFNQLSSIKQEITDTKNKIDLINGEINYYEIEIKSIRKEINTELSKTRSEEKLANNINKKLRNYVSFELEHIGKNKNLNQGYYRIRNKSPFSEKYREIDTLSKGEKNIIGFLYFIEKLNEYREIDLDKIIIFDDPMDSNDDTMQYIIITEIQELMKLIDKCKQNSKLIIMTHNVHFYLNIKYNRLYQDGIDRHGKEKKGDRFIRLEKREQKVVKKTLNSEGEDFSTNYELLWKELRFLYENNKPNLMLNSIRRIIETFTKFNRTNNFFGNNREAQKLFNVNSHSIDDLEAELNGKNNEDIIKLMKECFINNNAETHFKTCWKASKK